MNPLVNYPSYKQAASGRGRAFLLQRFKAQVPDALDDFVRDDNEAARVLHNATQKDQLVRVAISAHTFSAHVDVATIDGTVGCPEPTSLGGVPNADTITRYYFRGQAYAQGSDGLCALCANRLQCLTQGKPAKQFINAQPRVSPTKRRSP